MASASSMSSAYGRSGYILLSLVLLSAMGPYVGVGLRTEQLVVYVVALLLVVLHLHRLRGVPALKLIGPWMLYVVVAAIGAVFPAVNRSSWARGGLLAGLDRILFPLAVTAIVAVILTRGGSPLRLLRLSASWVVALAYLNAAAAVATWLLGVTWGAWWSSAEESNASRSLTMGRFTGLMNAPSEAGVLYGLALLCAVFLWPTRQVRMVCTVLVIGAAGLLTVSKIFLLVAVPLVIWELVRMREQRGPRAGAALLLAALLWVVAISGTLPTWSGADHLRRMLPGSEASWLEIFSANRYGSTSTLAPVAEAVVEGPLLAGFGAAGLAVAYDAVWLEMFVTAGLIGLFVLVVISVTLWKVWYAMPKESAERRFAAGVLILFLGASAGLPVLTANRIGTFTWVLLVLFVAASTKLRHESGLTPHPPQPSNDAHRFRPRKGRSSRITRGV